MFNHINPNTVISIASLWLNFTVLLFVFWFTRDRKRQAKTVADRLDEIHRQ